MKKLLTLGVLSVLLMVFASSCNSTTKKIAKLQKNINTAITKNDFVTAHQYLGELLQIPYYNSSHFDEVKKTSVREVYLSEIRYLVAENDESSWNRAYMLPMEVPILNDYHGHDQSKGIKKELYKALYDYAVEYENAEIVEKTGKKLGIIKEEKMIVPVSTSISGPNGGLFAVVAIENGNKLVWGGETWDLTVEIKRVKSGKLQSGQHNVCISLLDEDDSVIDGTFYYKTQGGYSSGFGILSGLGVGESVCLTFSGAPWEATSANTDNVKNAAKFKVYSE